MDFFCCLVIYWEKARLTRALKVAYLLSKQHAVQMYTISVFAVHYSTNLTFNNHNFITFYLPFNTACLELVEKKLRGRNLSIKLWEQNLFRLQDYQLGWLLFSFHCHFHLKNKMPRICYNSTYQLRITESIRERPLRATRATIGATMLPATAVWKPTLLF